MIANPLALFHNKIRDQIAVLARELTASGFMMVIYEGAPHKSLDESSPGQIPKLGFLAAGDSAPDARTIGVEVAEDVAAYWIKPHDPSTGFEAKFLLRGMPVSKATRAGFAAVVFNNILTFILQAQQRAGLQDAEYIKALQILVSADGNLHIIGETGSGIPEGFIITDTGLQNVGQAGAGTLGEVIPVTRGTDNDTMGREIFGTVTDLAQFLVPRMKACGLDHLRYTWTLDYAPCGEICVGVAGREQDPSLERVWNDVQGSEGYSFLVIDNLSERLGEAEQGFYRTNIVWNVSINLMTFVDAMLDRGGAMYREFFRLRWGADGSLTLSLMGVDVMSEDPSVELIHQVVIRDGRVADVSGKYMLTYPGMVLQ